MLEFVTVSTPHQIKNLLNTYDPLKDTWIVSDLKSKQEIQNISVSRYGYFSDDAILRVSDFWKLWIRRLAPTTQVVSSDFIKVIVQNFIEDHGQKLGVAESEILTLTKAVQEFAPILLHPNGDELVQEWLEAEFEKDQKQKKWTRWYQLAKIVTNYLLDRNLIDARWSAAFMQTLDLNLFRWPRRLIIDLGSELSSVEMGLFKTLSQTQDVVVIVPQPVFADRFPYLLNVYKENLGQGKVTNAPALATQPALSKDQFVRLSTQLAEVKFAVATARQWADSGVALDDIAIIAADIEKYWPVLQHYLEEEGLPYSKDTVASLNGLGDVQNLLAVLKNYSPDVSWDSLEKITFASNQNVNFQFEKFKGLFYQLYDQDDLGRDGKIKELYYRKVDYSAPISREEFLKFLAIEIWPRLPESSSKGELFEVIFKDLIGQSVSVAGLPEGSKGESRFKRSLWVSFLKNRLSSKERTIQRSQQGGINIFSLMSAHMTSSVHKIYIGMNEESFLKRNTTLIGLQDSNALKNVFDLAVESSEESYLDFNLRWQSLTATPKTIFTSAHMSFNSDPLNASLFFIENCPQSEVLVPAPTRVDELQGALSTGEAKSNEISASRLLQDKNGFEAQLNPAVFKTLSASDIENYAQCSFKLLAAKGFRLRTDAQAALDLDHRDKGSLAHSLFEFLLKNISEDFNEETVIAFLDNERQERRLFINLDRIWQIQRGKFMLLAKKFYKIEKERSKVFSFEVEKQVQVYFDIKSGQFTMQKPEAGEFQFNLRVDRVDTHREKKYCIIYDYKSSERTEHKSGNWISDYQFQMLLYIAALKLTLPQELSIKGSLYYYYKNFKINTGIVDSEIGLNEFLFNKRNSSLHDETEWADLDQEFSKTLTEVLTRLNNGEFTTKPYEPVICNDCDWRKLCRATHLN
jgi:RecB family exonuclease